MENKKELFEIYAGTYEEFMLGFKFYKTDDDYTLEQTVADHTHKGSIRAINSRGYLLATGGFDEIIHVYNLDESREIGTLTQHSGTITCLFFTSDEKHLISCSEDGTIAIYRVGSWIMEKLWTKAHKGTYVNWIAVHPSNKMALSVGNDGNLRTWNLIEGTSAFVTDISHLCKRPELVVWSRDGSLYAVPHENEISIFSVVTANVQQSYKLQSKITCAHFFEDNILFVGDMTGYVYELDLTSEEVKRELQVTESRIKSMASHDDHLIVATSQGLVAVYEVTSDGLTELAKADSGCRITCLTAFCHCHRRERSVKKKKLNTNSAVKTEYSDELIGNSKEKVSSKSKSTSEVKRPRKRKVECFPPRQSWIVEEQET